MVKAKANKPTEYFLAGPTYDSDKRKSFKSTQHIHKDFDEVFNGIGCFEGTFSLQLKLDSKVPGTAEMCGICIAETVSG